MEIVYVGLDLESSAFQWPSGPMARLKVNRSFTTSEANLRAAFANQRAEIHVHLEAGELAPWAASVIAPLVTRVVCSHPKDNAWIAKDADKCDRVDAYKLAELLRLNRFKEVHYPTDQPRRNFKQLVQHYDELTAQQARLKTKLKARLRMQGVIVSGERVFSSSGRKPVLAEVKSPALRTAIKKNRGQASGSAIVSPRSGRMTPISRGDARVVSPATAHRFVGGSGRHNESRVSEPGRLKSRRKTTSVASTKLSP